MYSPIPVLSDVLYYTPTDAYNYMTDNRPLYQLDSNIRAVASAMVAGGYGEHASVSGNALTPGYAVELLPTGLIKYPDSATAGELTSGTTPIIGLVIGVTGAGLSKVIWGASLLDLDVLGLVSVIGSGATSGQYLIAAHDATGSIGLSSSYTATSDLVLGVVRNNTYVSIGRDAVPAMVSDPTPQANALSNYGLTRKRNFYLFQDINATPIQYIKKTLYAGGIAGFGNPNPLYISFSPSTGQIIKDPTPDPTSYGAPSSDWVLREVYSQFLAGSGTLEDVRYASTVSMWSSSLAYPTNFGTGYNNYELQASGASLDFTDPINLATFKKFNIVKYYQYYRVAPGNPLYGKIYVTATIIDPIFDSGSQVGGETSRTMVCDFTNYDSTGRETLKYRTVLTGASADTLYNDTTIFTSGINNGSSF